MTSHTPLSRALQLVAATLGLGILGLFAAWVLDQGNESLIRPESAELPTAPREAHLETGNTAAPSGPVRRTAPSQPSEDTSPSSTLSGRALLYGAVTDAQGEPTTGGYLWLYRDDVLAGRASLKAGRFAFAGIAPGRYRLRSRIAGELPFERAISVSAPVTRFDVELEERWQITVAAVTPDGEPLLGAIQGSAAWSIREALQAVAIREPLASNLPPSNFRAIRLGLAEFQGARGFGRQAGTNPMPADVIGTLTLPPDAPAHVALLLRHVLIAQTAVTPGQEKVTFTVATDAVQGSLATVHVRLVDAHGAPVAKARVALNDAQSGGGGHPTDEDGRVTIAGLMPGQLDLEVYHRDLTAPMVQVDVAPGADLDLGELVMRPGIEVVIDMSNFEGKGFVRLNQIGPPLPPGMASEDAYLSNENGRTFPFKLHPGRYGIFASAENGSAIREIDLTTAPTEPIGFDLRPAGKLRVVNEVGEGFAKLEITNRSGLLIQRRELTGSHTATIRLPPDTYFATITDLAGKVERRSVVVAAAGATLTIP